MAGQILAYSLVSGTQVLLLALALYVIYAVSKVQNLALGAVASAVAYSLYFARTEALPFFFWIIIPLCTAVVLGVVCFFLDSPFIKKQQHLLALLASFSFGVFLEAIISIAFGTEGRSLSGGILPVYTFGNYQLPLPGVFTLALGVIFAIIALFIIKKTSFGRILRAIASNSFSAVSLGINEKKVRFFSYIVAGIIAGTIGILVGLNTAITPTMGFNLIIMAFIAFLVGGVHDVRGIILASYLITVIPEGFIGFSQNTSASWKMVVVFVIAFIALAFRPEGLFTQQQRKK